MPTLPQLQQFQAPLYQPATMRLQAMGMQDRMKRTDIAEQGLELEKQKFEQQKNIQSILRHIQAYDTAFKNANNQEEFNKIMNDFGYDTDVKFNGRQIKDMKVLGADGKTYMMDGPRDIISDAVDAVSKDPKWLNNPQTSQYLKQNGVIIRPVEDASTSTKQGTMAGFDPKTNYPVDTNGNYMSGPLKGQPYDYTHGQLINKTESSQASVRRVYFDDAQKIANGIKNGTLPPDTLERTSKRQVASMATAMLADEGYNLSKAQQDYKATQKYLGSLNSVQQVRLRQAVELSYESLDKIEELTREWNAGPFPLLNKAVLKTAIEGGLGEKAQNTATALNTQIADLTSELATVYKGGNSSTDESLRLAAENLKAEWAYSQLMNNIELVRTNLGYRKNSMRFMKPAGISSESPYIEGRVEHVERGTEPTPTETRPRFKILKVE